MRPSPCTRHEALLLLCHARLWVGQGQGKADGTKHDGGTQHKRRLGEEGNAVEAATMVERLVHERKEEWASPTR